MHRWFAFFLDRDYSHSTHSGLDPRLSGMGLTASVKFPLPLADMGLRKHVCTSENRVKTMAKCWYVLMHDKNFHQSLIDRIEALGVEVYSPTRITLCKRKNRPSPSKYEVLLFPGYLLINMNMEQVASTAITTFNGAYGFVRFGDQDPCKVRDCEIEKLKAELKAYRDALENPAVVSIFDKSKDQTVKFLVRENSPAARCAAFYALLKQYDLHKKITKRPKMQMSY
jgi:transcriptional antiterminator RfaH